MQKIKSITLRNFKYFYGNETYYSQNKLELGPQGHNLLLYGENGSGKSSIYWALYTFLQSCLKKNAEISKYFDPSNSQNLRNRFADDADDSAIILEIVNPGGTITKEISNRRLETNIAGDTTVNRIIAGSDFINYKYLSKLYDFRNSQEIDLFDWLEREVLMFVDFDQSYTDNHGNLSRSTLASDWWKFICVAPRSFTPNKKNKNTAYRHSEEYTRYVHTTLPKFESLLKSFLEKITVNTNEYLSTSFNENFQIKFDTDSINCSYNNWVKEHAEVTRPKIKLTVIFDHQKLADQKKPILKPHTFLNEARLTAIALAIRLAMLDDRLYDVNSASLLVLDDLLLSLDMSHRDKVLDIVLKKVDEYQILILTHDRGFYNLCKRRIDSILEKDDTYKWEFKEMYQDENDEGIPIPFTPENQNYLDRAKKYLKEFDYPACANYLRKETERLLTLILPDNMTLHLKESDDEGTKPLKLENMIANLRKYYQEIGGNFTPFEKLKEHKDLLMNPLSHDNIDTPIYKRELLSSIELIEKLRKLKVVVYQTDSDHQNPLVLKETDTAGDDWEYTFFLHENFRIIKDLSGDWLLNNPKCFFTTRKNTSQNLTLENLNVDGKLSSLYGNVRFKIGTKTKLTDNPKDLKDIIFVEGTKLIDLLNAA